MNLRFVFGICTSILLLGIGATTAEGEGGEVAQVEEKSCQKWIFDLLSIAMEAAIPCLSGHFNFRVPSELVTKAFCFVKCILDGLGLLDEEGKLDGISAAVFFGENFPTVQRNEIVVKADPCFKLADEFNAKEYYCKSYAGFAQCAGTVVVTAMVPYVIGCFGSPFVTAGLNAAFSFLINSTPGGRSREPRELRDLAMRINNSSVLTY